MKTNSASLENNISIILPAHNEKENLSPLITKIVNVISPSVKDYEIIIVDDASSDGTYEAVVELIKLFPNVRYTRLKKHCGLSTALAVGIKMSTKDAVITMDSDLQYDPDDIPMFLNGLDKYDLVCGWRNHRSDSFLKRLASKIANFIRDAIFNDNIHDSGCNLRAFRKDCLKDIELFDGFHRFLPTLFKIKNFKILEIKVRHLPRQYGKSKFNIRKRIIRVLLDVFLVKMIKSRQIDYGVIDKVN